MSIKKNIIITGAGGMIGPMLAQRLLNDGYNLILTDIVEPKAPTGGNSETVKCFKGDICDQAFVKQLLEAAAPLHAVCIFHGIMSAGSEANFDLSMKVNIESVRNMLLQLRQLPEAPVRVVYSSSQAVYGQPLPKVITDSVTPTPEGTYGAHKYSTEIILNDMHRKGFVDAFAVRFPTVVVRPGLPSNAAPSFLSGMIREPMKGEECVIPLTDRSYRTYVCSPSSCIENLVRVLNLKTDALPNHQRHIMFPGISTTIQEMMDALAKHGGEDKLKLLREETNPTFERILRSWPEDFDPSTPDKLGLLRDRKVEDLVKEYIDTIRK